jgi:DnaJ-class molecular chaperone
MQLIEPAGGIPKETSSGRLDSGVNYQYEEYLIHEQLTSPEGIPVVKCDSNIVYEEEHAATCDICNGSGEEPCNVPESRSSVRLDSNVNCQGEFVTCDVCNGSGYLMHGLPVTKKIRPC